PDTGGNTMAINLPSTPPPPPPSKLLTYEDYMEEEHFEGRYDIIDGVRIVMPGATWSHQETVGNILEALRRYARKTGKGKPITAPFDVLIRRLPRLRTSQPDVLYITNMQLAQGGGIPDKGPLEVAPELIVEVLSESETPGELEAKLADYVSIGVQEAWIVRS